MLCHQSKISSKVSIFINQPGEICLTKLGGFSFNGKIDLILNVITVNIYWNNKDNFETKRISINNLERKKMK